MTLSAKEYEAKLRKAAQFKHELDGYLTGAPVGHVFCLSDLPKRIAKGIRGYQALGATFGDRVLLKVDGREDCFLVQAVRQR